MHDQELSRILADDPFRLQALSLVRALDLADGWIGAGFVRDAIWDRLHGRPVQPPIGDIDVLWFDASRATPDVDKGLEASLLHHSPASVWSVKNQARMHDRNGDAPYTDVADAMRHWPETATAVAVRLSRSGQIEINAPFGLYDLFGLRLQPTPDFVTSKRAIFDARVRSKRWLERYPLLRS